MQRTTGRGLQQRRMLAAPLVALTTGGFGQVPVHFGDSLWGLARRHHTTVTALQQANGLTTDRIYAGTALRLPSTNSSTSRRSGSGHPAAAVQVRYRVSAGDYLIRIAAHFRVSPAAIAAANHLDAASTVYLGSTLRISHAIRAYRVCIVEMEQACHFARMRC